jgi:hypothetical protein
MDPDGLQNNLDYNAYLIAQGDTVEVSGEDADTNMARITLHQVQLPPSLQNTGTLTITLSNPACVRLFDSDGELLSPADLTIDLTAPTGLLAGLANDDEDIYVEGLTANPDLTITYTYKGTGTGSAVTGSTAVHMAVAAVTLFGSDGSPLAEIPGFTSEDDVLAAAGEGQNGNTGAAANYVGQQQVAACGVKIGLAGLFSSQLIQMGVTTTAGGSLTDMPVVTQPTSGPRTAGLVSTSSIVLMDPTDGEYPGLSVPSLPGAKALFGNEFDATFRTQYDTLTFDALNPAGVALLPPIDQSTSPPTVGADLGLRQAWALALLIQQRDSLIPPGTTSNNFNELNTPQKLVILLGALCNRADTLEQELFKTVEADPYPDAKYFEALDVCQETESEVTTSFAALQLQNVQFSFHGMNDATSFNVQGCGLATAREAASHAQFAPSDGIASLPADNLVIFAVADCAFGLVFDTSMTGSVLGNTAGGQVVRYGPQMQGPLPAEYASAFRGGVYDQITLESDTTLYRIYGGDSGKLSSWWSRTPPSGPMQTEMDLALPPGNTMRYVVEIKVPAGTTIYEGAAGPSSVLLGGGNQIFMFEADPTWIVKWYSTGW